MKTILTTKRYPLVSFSLKLDDFNLESEAYADTGAEEGLYIPKHLFNENKIRRDSFTSWIMMGDGSVHHWETYMANIKIGGRQFIGNVVVSTGDEIILGREILDQVRAVFDGPDKELILKAS